MLKAIRFENFQGFKGEIECRIAPITLIFGPNASGKSTFRRALETFRDAVNDESVNLANSRLTKKLEYLSYGWTKSNPGDMPFGLGLTFEGSVSGVTQSANLIPNSAEFCITFADTSGGLQLEQVIGFVPGQFARLLDFTLTLEEEQLSESTLAIVLNALAEFADELDLLEKEDPLEFLRTAPGVEELEKLTINVSQDDVSAMTTRRKNFRSVIEHFNESQQHIAYSLYSALETDAKHLAKKARILMSLIEDGVEKFLDREPTEQVFSYSARHKALKLEFVAGHFPSSFPVEPPAVEEAASDYSENEESKYQDDLMASLLSDKISTKGFLLDSDAFEDEDEYWRDGDLSDPEDAIFQIRRALKRNSHSVRKFLNQNFRTIEPWRGVPAEEAQGDSSELPGAVALSKMNEALGRITNNRYLFQFENEVGVRSSRNIRTVLDTFTGVTLPYGDVGTGLSQLLPILHDLATESSGLTYIEQPELHLHPRAQGALMDVILDSWLEEQNQEGERQFILETHSESMLLRLQKRIRKGDIRSEDVAVVFVDSVSPADSPDGRGYNNISELALDNLGDVLDPFPVSFVSMRLEDLL